MILAELVGGGGSNELCCCSISFFLKCSGAKSASFGQTMVCRMGETDTFRNASTFLRGSKTGPQSDSSRFTVPSNPSLNDNQRVKPDKYFTLMTSSTVYSSGGIFLRDSWFSASCQSSWRRSLFSPYHSITARSARGGNRPSTTPVVMSTGIVSHLDCWISISIEHHSRASEGPDPCRTFLSVVGTSGPAATPGTLIYGK